MKKKTHYGDVLWDLYADIQTSNSWPDPQCIHYSEPAAIAIQMLEDWLMGKGDLFADEMRLVDTNRIFKERYSNWQYPVKEDWIINRKNLGYNGLDSTA